MVDFLIDEGKNKIEGLPKTAINEALQALNTALSGKADATAVNEALQAVNTALNEKADATAVNEALQALNTALSGKADATAVNEALQAVNTALNGKADAQAVANDFQSVNNDLNKTNGIITSKSASVLENAKNVETAYINSNGEPVNSGSWKMFVYEISDCIIESISVYTNNSNFLAFAFYSDEPAANSFISGVAFGSSTTSAKVFNNIVYPTNAKYIAIATRTSTSTNHNIIGRLSKISPIVDQVAETSDKLNYIDQLKTLDGSSNEYNIGNYLVNASDGSLSSSANWTSYKYDIEDFFKIEGKVYQHTSEYNDISFYSGEPSTSTYISGDYVHGGTQGTLGTFSITQETIPQNTKYVVISNRSAYGSGFESTIYRYLNNQFNKFKKDISEELNGYEDIIDRYLPFVKNEVSALNGKSNLRAIYKDTVNTNDFTVVKNELWLARNIYEVIDGQNVATDRTYIYRYKIEENGDLTLNGVMYTNFSHWNTVDYCEATDTLLLNNSANLESTSGNWIAVIPNASQLPMQPSAVPQNMVKIEDYGIKYELSEDFGFKVNAVWGEDNLGEHNIVYLLSNNTRTLNKVLLFKTNGEFNGNMQVIDTQTMNDGYGIGGMDFWGNKLVVGWGAGYKLIIIDMESFEKTTITRKFYYPDGTEYVGTVQGVHIDSKYIWVFVNVGGLATNFLMQYYR